MIYVRLWLSAVYKDLSRAEVLKKTWLHPQAQFKHSQENKAGEGDNIFTAQQGQAEHISDLRL